MFFRQWVPIFFYSITYFISAWLVKLFWMFQRILTIFSTSKRSFVKPKVQKEFHNPSIQESCVIGESKVHAHTHNRKNTSIKHSTNEIETRQVTVTFSEICAYRFTQDSLWTKWSKVGFVQSCHCFADRSEAGIRFTGRFVEGFGLAGMSCCDRCWWMMNDYVIIYNYKYIYYNYTYNRWCRLLWNIIQWMIMIEYAYYVYCVGLVSKIYNVMYSTHLSEWVVSTTCKTQVARAGAFSSCWHTLRWVVWLLMFCWSMLLKIAWASRVASTCQLKCCKLYCMLRLAFIMVPLAQSQPQDLLRTSNDWFQSSQVAIKCCLFLWFAWC